MIEFVVWMVRGVRDVGAMCYNYWRSQMLFHLIPNSQDRRRLEDRVALWAKLKEEAQERGEEFNEDFFEFVTSDGKEKSPEESRALAFRKALVRRVWRLIQLRHEEEDRLRDKQGGSDAV